MSRYVSKRSWSAAVLSGAVVLGAGLSACQRTESTATLLAEAKQYQAKGDNKAALIQLKNAVSKSPEDGEARLLLASAYRDGGDPVSAEKEVRKAMSLKIAAERTLPILAASLLAQGQFQKVLDEITPEAAAKSAALLAVRGDASLALGQQAQAKELYQQALAVQPNSGEALVGLARHAIGQNDSAAAQRYADEAVAKDAKNPEAWMFKGMLLRGKGKPEEALVAYDQALLLKPEHRTAHIEKAYTEIGLGKFDAAKADLDAARKLAPGNLVITYTQALLDFTQGKNAVALESLQKVLRVAPEHMPSILLAGAVELNLGSIQQAEKHLRKYVEAFPANLYARKLLAQALLKSSQPADAAAALAPALKEPSEDPQLLALAGQSYIQSKDYDKATSYFEKASALAPKTAALHTSLGLAKLGQGDKAKAVSELELAASLDPKSPNAGIALVQTELSLKHFDKALVAAENLEKQQPDNPQVQNLKGGVYLSMADPVKARAAFEKAVALQATFYPAVANLAQLDMREGKPAAAKARMQALLDKDKKNIAVMSALADIALADHHPEEATTWLEKAVADNPDAVAPAIRLASHYLRQKQEQKALTLVRKYQTADPANADLLDLLGQTQLANKDAAGALETYSKLVNVLPKSAPAQLRLAAVHLELKNDGAAAEDLKRALALDPNLLQARLGQVTLAMRRNNPDEAMAVVRQIQKQNDKSNLGYVLEGDVLVMQKKFAQALPAYDKAFGMAKSPQLLVKIAEVMKALGKAKEGRARLDQWAKEQPKEPVVALYLADAALGEQQYKEAIARFEALLKTTPGNALLLNNLAYAYQKEKDPRALATAEQALKAAPNSPAILDTVGWMLTEQGNATRGLPLLQQAVTLAPSATELRYHLAVALQKTGDKAGARKEIDKLLSNNKTFPQMEDAKSLLRIL
ncbi:MAG: XrtA/PEP-CTERM system TPR-repeat protein PrsT [Massilia sp.]